MTSKIELLTYSNTENLGLMGCLPLDIIRLIVQNLAAKSFNNSSDSLITNLKNAIVCLRNLSLVNRTFAILTADPLTELRGLWVIRIKTLPQQSIPMCSGGPPHPYSPDLKRVDNEAITPLLASFRPVYKTISTSNREVSKMLSLLENFSFSTLDSKEIRYLSLDKETFPTQQAVSLFLKKEEPQSDSGLSKKAYNSLSGFLGWNKDKP